MCTNAVHISFHTTQIDETPFDTERVEKGFVRVPSFYNPPDCNFTFPDENI